MLYFLPMISQIICEIETTGTRRCRSSSMFAWYSFHEIYRNLQHVTRVTLVLNFQYETFDHFFSFVYTNQCYLLILWWINKYISFWDLPFPFEIHCQNSKLEIWIWNLKMYFYIFERVNKHLWTIVYFSYNRREHIFPIFRFWNKRNQVWFARYREDRLSSSIDRDVSVFEYSILPLRRIMARPWALWAHRQLLVFCPGVQLVADQSNIYPRLFTSVLIKLISASDGHVFMARY